MSKKEIKMIFATTVSRSRSRSDWAANLDDSLWPYYIADKARIGMSPNQLMFRKACNLPLELEHRAL